MAVASGLGYWLFAAIAAGIGLVTIGPLRLFESGLRAKGGADERRPKGSVRA